MQTLSKCGLYLGLAAATILGAGQASADLLLHSFENTLDGPLGTAVGPTGNQAGATLSYSTTGVTDGSSSIQFDTTGGGEGRLVGGIDLTPAYRAALTESKEIAVDVTGLTAGGETDDYGVALYMFFNGAALQTSKIFGLPGDQSLQTLVFSISDTAIAAMNSGDFLQVQLAINNGGPNAANSMTATFDNFRVVEIPEPGSSALVGAGASLLLLRRKD